MFKKKYWVCSYSPKVKTIHDNDEEYAKRKPFTTIIYQWMNPKWSNHFKFRYNLETVEGPFSYYDGAAKLSNGD